ncbi:hypothetical protein [Mycolicibacterium iranicum]|uniref:Peptidase M41 domain-containing protein n=1 Tax=Mycolicibacterium iranicum TaxID=912594 RepID=A0ABT4HP39_MYCIR|nr:hypothetical protein [Mycolicibacterium iranicum]MCZ0731865.1 hypothetical protein [Mycolicibacterium iranicum]
MFIDITDEATVAKVAAQATARHAHHEAGHAVAAVYRGSRLVRVFLGTADWSTFDMSGDTPGGTEHISRREQQPFITFAGPWAEAKWTTETDDDVDDMDDALEFAWLDNADGDADKYAGRVQELDDAAAHLGFHFVGRSWEFDWSDELEELWPAICEVAALLIDGKTVTHDHVKAAVDRCAVNEADQ